MLQPLRLPTREGAIRQHVRFVHAVTSPETGLAGALPLAAMHGAVAVGDGVQFGAPALAASLSLLAREH